LRIEIKALRAATDEDKLSPQAKVIMETIIGKVGLNTAIAKTDLITQLDDDGALNTRQGAAKVLTFYMPRLIEDGLMEKERVAEAADAEKPAKATKKTSTKAKAAVAAVV
jgi:hypothetical protein